MAKVNITKGMYENSQKGWKKGPVVHEMNKTVLMDDHVVPFNLLSSSTDEVAEDALTCLNLTYNEKPQNTQKNNLSNNYLKTTQETNKIQNDDILKSEFKITQNNGSDEATNVFEKDKSLKTNSPETYHINQNNQELAHGHQSTINFESESAIKLDIPNDTDVKSKSLFVKNKYSSPTTRRFYKGIQNIQGSKQNSTSANKWSESKVSKGVETNKTLNKDELHPIASNSQETQQIFKHSKPPLLKDKSQRSFPYDKSYKIPQENNTDEEKRRQTKFNKNIKPENEFDYLPRNLEKDLDTAKDCQLKDLKPNLEKPLVPSKPSEIINSKINQKETEPNKRILYKDRTYKSMEEEKQMKNEHASVKACKSLDSAPLNEFTNLAIKPKNIDTPFNVISEDVASVLIPDDTNKMQECAQNALRSNEVEDVEQAKKGNEPIFIGKNSYNKHENESRCKVSFVTDHESSSKLQSNWNKIKTLSKQDANKNSFVNLQTETQSKTEIKQKKLNKNGLAKAFDKQCSNDSLPDKVNDVNTETLMSKSEDNLPMIKDLNKLSNTQTEQDSNKNLHVYVNELDTEILESETENISLRQMDLNESQKTQNKQDSNKNSPIYVNELDTEILESKTENNPANLKNLSKSSNTQTEQFSNKNSPIYVNELDTVILVSEAKNNTIKQMDLNELTKTQNKQDSNKNSPIYVNDIENETLVFKSEQTPKKLNDIDKLTKTLSEQGTNQNMPVKGVQSDSLVSDRKRRFEKINDTPIPKRKPTHSLKNTMKLYSSESCNNDSIKMHNKSSINNEKEIDVIQKLPYVNRKDCTKRGSKRKDLKNNDDGNPLKDQNEHNNTKINLNKDYPQGHGLVFDSREKARLIREETEDETSKTGSSNPENPNTGTNTKPIQKLLKRKRVISIVCFVCGIIIGLIVGLFIGLHTSKCPPGDGIAESLSSNLLNCSGDNFESLTFSVQAKSGGKVEVSSYIKYFIVNANGSRIAFHQITKMCDDLNATLWEVQNESEWIAVTDKLKSKPGMTMDFWLNGNVEGSVCQSGSECLKTNATRGDGLPLRWRSSNELATYSRLYKGETSERKCIRVEETGDNLWTVGYCELEGRPGVCVKRNCSKE